MKLVNDKNKIKNLIDENKNLKSSLDLKVKEYDKDVKEHES
jgi:cell shape-determining protein MreC